MSVLNSPVAREPRYQLLFGVVAGSYTLVAMLLPIEPAHRYAAALLGIWLVFALLIRYVGLRGARPLSRGRWIPLRFTGELGRFQLRSRGDGRRVEVRSGVEVVAEAIATDEGDELLVDFEAAEDSELDAFGAAIGQAIEMAAAADADRPPAEDSAAGPGRRPES